MCRARRRVCGRVKFDACADGAFLGHPVVPFYLVLGEGSPTKKDYSKKGTLILTSLLEDLVFGGWFPFQPRRSSLALLSPEDDWLPRASCGPLGETLAKMVRSLHAKAFGFPQEETFTRQAQDHVLPGHQPRASQLDVARWKPMRS